MIVGYMIPVDFAGFSTTAAYAGRREMWCKNCATPCHADCDVPTDHVAVMDNQVLNSESCNACGKRL